MVYAIFKVLIGFKLLMMAANVVFFVMQIVVQPPGRITSNSIRNAYAIGMGEGGGLVLLCDYVCEYLQYLSCGWNFNLFLNVGVMPCSKWFRINFYGFRLTFLVQFEILGPT